MNVCLVSDRNDVIWDCPGCGIYHRVQTAPDKKPKWDWNGNRESPTISPSVLVRWTKTSDDGLTKISDVVCHCFVREGKIQFLSDCTHQLAGQTVDMKDIERD